MILLVDFYVHFTLLLSKRGHLKDSSAKKCTSTENFGDVGGGGGGGGWLPLWAPCSGGRVKVLKNNVWSDGTYGISLFYYQMTTYSAVNRNGAYAINNWNHSSYYLWTNKVKYNFCMINELLIWFKVKITDNCFDFIGG